MVNDLLDQLEQQAPVTMKVICDMTTSDWINSIVAIATVLMAIATYWMARTTRKLATDTAAATKQTDRHHREDARPFCVVDFEEASQQFPFGPKFDPNDRRLQMLMVAAAEITPTASINVRGRLHNKGRGPATGIMLYLNTRVGVGGEGAFRLTSPVFVSGLVGPGETVSIEVTITERNIMPTWNGKTWTPVQAFHAVANQTYEVVLEYKDVFDDPFRTVHARGIWTDPIPDIADPAVRERIMTRPDRPTPEFLIGRQSVRSLTELVPSWHEITPPDERPQF